MQQVARLALGARRWQPYLKTFRFAGVDLTGAALEMQIRLYPNAPGSPLVDLDTVTDSNAQGVRLLGVEEVDGVPVSTVSIKINETTVEALPFAAEAGDDTVLAWDMQVTQAGGYKEVWAEGEFWVLAAVTGAGTVPLGAAPGGGEQLRRPSFHSGTIPFQIGDTEVTLQIAGGVGPKGDPGQEAAPAARVDFLAVQDQTTFPVTGNLEALDPPFHWDEAGVVELNGQEISPLSDYTAITVDGGIAIQLAEGVDAGDTVTLHAFQLTGMENGSILKRASFSIGKSGYQKLTEIIALDDAREANADYDDDALAQLISDGFRRIRLRAAQGTGTSGEYQFDVDPWITPPVGDDFSASVEAPGNLVSGIELFGDGMGADPAYNTHVVSHGANMVFIYNSLSDDPNDNAEDMALRTMRIIGKAETLPHSEFTHLVAAHGFTRFALDRVAMFAGQGDGFFGSMGFRNDGVRYNRDFLATGCHFDGVVKKGRNAISLEAIDRARILGSYFARWSTADHPGAIDIEPIDRPEYEARGITIAGNTFEDYNNAAVVLNLGRPTIFAVPTGIVRVFDNTMRDGRVGVDAFGGWNRADDLATLVRHRVQVFANDMERVIYPLRAEGMAGLDFHHNEVTDFETFLIGNDSTFSGQNFVNIGLKVEDNTLTRGGVDAVWTQANDTIDCSISRNTLIDCGDPDAETPVSYGFLARRGEIGMRVNDNRVRETQGPRLAAFAVQTDEDAVIGASSQKSGNEFPDGAPPVADTFTPTTQPRGAYGNEVLTGDTIAAGASVFHDVTVQGAVKGQKFSVNLDTFLGPDDRLLTDAFSRDIGVVRAVLFNAGSSSITIPSGAVLTVAEVI
jgi:hypothetical protein